VIKPPVAQAWNRRGDLRRHGHADGGGAAGRWACSAHAWWRRRREEQLRMTQAASAGRWVDVTLYTSRNRALPRRCSRAAGHAAGATLKLMSRRKRRASRCDPMTTRRSSATTSAQGQDAAVLGLWRDRAVGPAAGGRLRHRGPADFQKFFIARSATQRGTHSAVGRPHWPSRDDTRMVPANASLVGEHAFTGRACRKASGSPSGGADIMPPIELAQRDAAGATVLEWKALPTGAAYFVAAMGRRKAAAAATPSRWCSGLPGGARHRQRPGRLPDQPRGGPLAEGEVLLAPTTTTCTVPKASSATARCCA